MLGQRSFDALGTPLSEVTFCVVDLETTGGSFHDNAITEIAGLKIRRGETIGTFSTLVDPGRPVPAFVRLLTGIDEALLRGAPDIAAALPNFIEFLGGAVIVAHNARFDVGFLNAAAEALGYPRFTNPVVDTARLARKVLGGEVPDHRLETLARHLRCAHRPSHRAFPDVLATVDLLHHLIERVAGFGVTTLEDLNAVTTARLDGTFRKIRLADDLPRGPGVYRFLGDRGNTLYVGKATDIRARVRSYFYGDARRRTRDLLRQTRSIVAEPYPSLLEAEIAEARSIAAEKPPYNRRGKRRSTTWYLKVACSMKVPRVSAARVPKADGAIYLGPFSSRRTVTRLIEALQDAAAIHRCNDPAKCRGCAFAELGRCSGTDRRRHRAEMIRLARCLLTDPGALLLPIKKRMETLAAAGRFEEAAEVRDRGAALESALHRFLVTRALLRAGEIVIADGNRALRFRGGRLIATCDAEQVTQPGLPSERMPHALDPDVVEISILMARLRRGDLRLLYCEKQWCSPVAARPASLFAVRQETD